MLLKTYRARTIADALSRIKQDLGRDAVILHTRTLKVGALFGFGGRTMVEITASSGVNVAPPRRQPDSPRARPTSSSDAILRAYASAAGPTDAAAPKSSDSFTLASATPAAPTEPVVQRAPARPAASLAVSAPFAPSSSEAAASIEQELSAIKSMVSRVLATSNGAHTPLMPEALQQHYLRLIEAEVASELANEVIAGVREDLSTAECDNPEAVRRAVLRRVAAHIPVCDEPAVPAPERQSDGRPRTIALIGPTGVGKTTTLAKLAATYRLRHGRSVGLITSDTYRIAAVDQLRTYANIIGLPVRVAATPREMKDACESFSDRDIVLIDTAGRSPSDKTRLDELREHLEVARPHETHLVLSAASGERALLAAAERFAPLGASRVILTKLDEAVSFGVLLNVLRRVDRRLSFVTTGQEVPDHIEAGRPDRLARLILDGAPS